MYIVHRTICEYDLSAAHEREHVDPQQLLLSSFLPLTRCVCPLQQCSTSLAMVQLKSNCMCKRMCARAHLQEHGTQYYLHRTCTQYYVRVLCTHVLSTSYKIRTSYKVASQLLICITWLLRGAQASSHRSTEVREAECRSAREKMRQSSIFKLRKQPSVQILCTQYEYYVLCTCTSTLYCAPCTSYIVHMYIVHSTTQYDALCNNI